MSAATADRVTSTAAVAAAALGEHVRRHENRPE
jgi:hypothetical protein